jgi:hypothetical protein
VEPVTYELPTQQVVYGVNRRFTYDEVQPLYMVAWLLGSIWTVEVMWAIGQFAVAFSVVVWFFSPFTADGERDLPSFLTLRAIRYAFTYHLGSMAWSGLLFGLFRIPAALCGIFDPGDAQDPSPSGLRLCRARVCCCCDWLNGNVFKFVITLAFPDLAVNSVSFTRAATSAWKTAMSYESAYRDLRMTLYLFLAIGVAAIATAGYLLGVLLITSNPDLMAEASGDFVRTRCSWAAPARSRPVA